MTTWREVQETLYKAFKDGWGSTTPFAFANEKFDPPNGPWARFGVIRLPGGPGTLGRPGNKKMDRAGLITVALRVPPGKGVGDVSDLAEKAAKIFENKRFATHDIRFAEVEPQEAGDVDNGRWWGVAVEGRFDYEEIR